MEKLTRRELIKGGLSTGLALVVGKNLLGERRKMNKAKFRLKYAPHFGMFVHHAGNDLVDQLKFAADEGFRAWEDNGMKSRPIAEQERIAKAMSQLGMEMGIFVINPNTAWKPSFSTGSKEGVDEFVKECRSAVEVAKRVNAKWMTLVPGTMDPRLDKGFQLANVIDGLRFGAEVLEPHGLVMVMEALNSRRDHPGMVLSKVADAYLICRAVNSPSLKILYDFYHQQIEDGNLIPNMDLCWSEIAYFQIGDTPGRAEPMSGETNYRNVFKHVYEKGYKGILGMEHGMSKPGKEGERALIEAYRWCDDF